MSDTPGTPQAPPPSRGLSGSIGKYEIVRTLGKGAMGQVYLARDTMLEREVALKVMVAQIADDPELKQRFEREAKAVAKMAHPNVVTVYDLGYHTDGSPYIAMELLKGQDLQKAMRTPPPMGLERKVEIIIQVLAGLFQAHQVGIVHRDIKPANVFLNLDGTVKIMDFGVARITTASMTGTGNIVGTADYMSPEQVQGARVDGRSDLFSVGCMLYELLAGRRPFHAENLMAIFYKITHEMPDFSLLPQDADHQSLIPILEKALTRGLNERYQSAYDFAVDLQEWLQVRSSGATAAIEGLLTPPGSAEPTLVTGDGVTALGSGRGTRPGTGRGTTGRRAPPTVRGAATSAAAPPELLERPRGIQPPRRAAAVQGRQASRPSGGRLWVLLGGGTVALVIAGVGAGWWLLQPAPAKPPPPPRVEVTAQATAAPRAEVTTPAPATPEAPPVIAETTSGRAVDSLKTAQAAFAKGDYGVALTAAQRAMREEPGNAGAQTLVQSAQKGTEALGRLRNGEAALKSGNLASAEAEAEAARGLAPWDPRATNLVNRVRDAQAQAARVAEAAAQAAAQTRKEGDARRQVADLLNRADDAMGKGQHDAAISLYDQALTLDQANAAARSGKTNAIGAKAVAQAAAQTGPSARVAVKGFVAAKTEAKGAEGKSGAVPEGFEESAGVVVKKATQAAALPGKILFEVKPESVRPGDTFSVGVSMLNEGAAPIQIKDMVVTSLINGRRSQGSVPSLAREVAPRQKALLFALNNELWKEETTSWSIEILVRTVAGETYRGQVAWK